MKLSSLAVTVCVFLSLVGGTATAQLPANASYPGPITLVDASTILPGDSFHAKLSMLASPGPLTLLYAKWIPGEHGPTGPIQDLTGLRFCAGGSVRLPGGAMTSICSPIHLDVPAGTNQSRPNSTTLHRRAAARVHRRFDGHGAAGRAQLELAALYPPGTRRIRLPVVPVCVSRRLAVRHRAAARGAVRDQLDFQPVSLYTLVDSPVLTGRFFREIALTAARGRRRRPSWILRPTAPPRWRCAGAAAAIPPACGRGHYAFRRHSLSPLQLSSVR